MVSHKGIVGPVLTTIVTTLFCAFVLEAQRGPRRDAMPMDPVAAILAAFETHRIVAVGESGHGNEQSHALRMTLLRDIRIVSIVDDFVVEFGSARYQALADRFVRGEVIEERELRKIWQDTTVPDYLWDRPIYEAFFREVRAANTRTRPNHRLRVLLGDPPIDWERVRDRTALFRWWERRDIHAAELIKREVVLKGRRALVFYGDAHLPHRPNGQGLVARVERDTGVSIFTISRPIAVSPIALQPEVSSWPAPSIALAAGTKIGAAEIEFRRGPDGQWLPVLFEERFDAFLYLGLPGSRTTPALSDSLCTDPTYIEMRLRRMALDPADRPEELHAECERALNNRPPRPQ